ncbi:signal peptidase II [uncultured Sphingomonas sp.]|uniref:signal peptidase II n=1 Tax=uncultured Sphingomonas sp. TaxID=158754 RepID=UPI0025E893A5|nr:signal peptidase II [uncultured Sphingomonas sp.]
MADSHARISPRTGLLVAALIFVADQLSKWLVAGPLGLTEIGRSIEVVPFFDLTRVHNHGISLGLLTAASATQRWLLVAFTAAIAALVTYWLFREPKRGDQIALGMVLGGALGNILDRARLGYVFDFADLHFGEFRPFLVFNVADAAISIGVAILILRALLIKDARPEEKVQDA